MTNPKDKIHSSWNPFLLDYLDKDTSLSKLNSEVLPKCVYYPEAQNIFNVFQMPLSTIKVVILEQDPYPQVDQAIGYAFAVNEGVNKPASLRIIEQEVGHEVDRTLQPWRDQGVFLLNTALTVEQGKAGSHLEYWTAFTKSVIQHISQNNPCIWLLWGKHAQSYLENIDNSKPIFSSPKEPLDNQHNYVLSSPHPAAEAYNSNAGFLGNQHFIITNNILKQQNKELINF